LVEVLLFLVEFIDGFAGLYQLWGGGAAGAVLGAGHVVVFELGRTGDHTLQ
jgi:hypothetical protein